VWLSEFGLIFLGCISFREIAQIFWCRQAAVFLLIFIKDAFVNLCHVVYMTPRRRLFVYEQAC
jgi:hypothetical protein